MNFKKLFFIASVFIFQSCEYFEKSLLPDDSLSSDAGGSDGGGTSDAEGSGSESGSGSGSEKPWNLSQNGEVISPQDLSLNFLPDAWKNTNLEKVSLLYKGQGQTLWVAKEDGTLEKTENEGESWVLVSTSRKAVVKQGSVVSDSSQITALLEINSSCGDWLVIGTKAGYVYKSSNGGATFQNPTGEEQALVKFTSKLSDSLNHSSPVYFISEKPDDEDGVYVGHANGLAQVDVCESNPGKALTNIDGAPQFFSFPPQVGSTFNNALYISNEKGFYKTLDGNTWEAIHDISGSVKWVKKNSNSLLGLGTPDKAWVFKNGRWSSQEISNPRSIASWRGLILLATQNKIYTSPDDGETWEILFQTIFSIKDLVVTSISTSQTLWVLTTEGKVFQTSLPSSQILTDKILKGAL